VRNLAVACRVDALDKATVVAIAMTERIQAAETVEHG
jgi:hypothetical protein